MCVVIVSDIFKPSEAATFKEKERPEQSCKSDSPPVEQSQVVMVTSSSFLMMLS